MLLCKQNMALTIGEEFDDYASFKLKIAELERNTNSVFVIDECKTVQSSNKAIKDPQKHYRDEFKYRYVKLVCKHYGTLRTSKGKVRPNQATFKMGCPVHITASVDRAKDKLVVLAANLHHSHNTSSILASTYPENRRLDKSKQTLCTSLLGLGVSATNIRTLLKDASGKPLTLRDIYNQQVMNDKKNAKEASDGELLVAAVDNMLQTDTGSTAVYAISDDSELRLLFWQTSEMRRVYEKFPQVLFVDVVHCVNSVHIPLYCLCVSDSCGNHRVCGYGLVADETFQSIFTLLELFREKNPAASQLSAVVVDKDFAEIACISQVFPSATVQICNFYALKAFRRVAAHYRQIKSMAANYIRCHKLFEALLHLDTNRSTECDYEQMVSLSKLRYQHGSAVQPEVTQLINATCTLYAADLVLKQLDAAVKNETTAIVRLAQSEALVSLDGCSFCAVDCTSTTCNCVFNNTTKLPCKHIFLWRANSDLDMFSADLIAQRWRKPVVAGTAAAVSPQGDSTADNVTAQRTDVLSKTNKCRRLTNVSKRLTDVLCSVGDSEFLAKLGLLEELVGLWSSNATVTLTVVSNADTATSASVVPTVIDPSDNISTAVAVSATSVQSLSSTDDATSATVVAMVADNATSRSLPVSHTVADLADNKSVQLSFAASTADANRNNIQLAVCSAVRDRPRGAAKTFVGKPKTKKVKAANKHAVLRRDSTPAALSECAMAAKCNTKNVHWIQCDVCSSLS